MTAAELTTEKIREFGAVGTDPDRLRATRLKLYIFDGTTAATGDFATFPGIPDATLIGCVVTGEAVQPSAVTISTNKATFAASGASRILHGIAWGH